MKHGQPYRVYYAIIPEPERTVVTLRPVPERPSVVTICHGDNLFTVGYYINRDGSLSKQLQVTLQPASEEQPDTQYFEVMKRERTNEGIVFKNLHYQTFLTASTGGIVGCGSATMKLGETFHVCRPTPPEDMVTEESRPARPKPAPKLEGEPAARPSAKSSGRGPVRLGFNPYKMHAPTHLYGTEAPAPLLPGDMLQPEQMRCEWKAGCTCGCTAVCICGFGGDQGGWSAWRVNGSEWMSFESGANSAPAPPQPPTPPENGAAA